ncbi:MAG: hypothetical protein ACR2P1_24205 [Pseudomonadales bacterium]
MNTTGIQHVGQEATAMQAQKLNTASTTQQPKAASPLPAAACKLRQVSSKVSVTANTDHKVSTATPKATSGGFSFAGIAG